MALFSCFSQAQLDALQQASAHKPIREFHISQKQWPFSARPRLKCNMWWEERTSTDAHSVHKAAVHIIQTEAYVP